jgi:hypothetical protein
MESTVLKCGSLMVTFQKRGDRYHHQIARTFVDIVNVIYGTREGTDDELWPPSPVLQSLHIEFRPAGVEAALLVGTAGRSHWSMSVETDPSKDRLLFDVACRIHDPPQWLGSTYHIAAASPSNQLKFTSCHTDSAAPACEIHIDESKGTVRIAPFIASQGGSQTIRWSYSVKLAVDA